MRDRSLPKPTIAKLWTEVKDHAGDEITAGARQQLEELIEGRIQIEFEDLLPYCREHLSPIREELLGGRYRPCARPTRSGKSHRGRELGRKR